MKATTKQDYEIKRDAIAKMEGITEAQRSGLLFGNWIDYIAKSAPIPERKSTNSLQLFVKFALNYQ
jgi:hypothetical protein